MHSRDDHYMDDEDDAVEFYAKKKDAKLTKQAQKGGTQVFKSSKIYDEEELKDVQARELGHVSND